ncbi:uncharacterized protein LOC114534777 [Dendronephthya gigantea]|uniref:uncharacterized protein LOC114534777 n=1 Tax=Dendronephthya gigantea TaxID=151771 RepID=UPI00106D689C|nr:uncharacterized protein LOC114534777 [Dendronephthya gigantea]
MTLKCLRGSTSGQQKPSSVAGAENDINMLKELCPDASESDICDALSFSSGNIDQAAQQLLLTDNQNDLPNVFIDDDDDQDIIQETENSFDSVPVVVDVSSPASALKYFQQQNTDEDSPHQRFSVCRMDGVAELRRDIIGIYKNQKTNLRAKPKVRFEEEGAVGSGPVREFLSLAMKVVEEGIPSATSKPLIFLEGDKDHLLPIHDQSLRLTGTFKALGRIIGHSILHGGPGLHGLSPTAVHYFTTDHELLFQPPPPVTLDDIPDIELRSLISQLDVMDVIANPAAELRCALQPYLFEAGIDPDNLISNKKLTVDGLILYQVRDKRRLELDDMANGSNGVVDIITFWTGSSKIDSTDDNSLLVTFDGGANMLPLAETCFKKVILPEKHNSYEVFKKYMDIAITHGAKGFSFT